MSLKHVIILRLSGGLLLQVARSDPVAPHQESLELLIPQESITAASTLGEIFDGMITHDQLVLVKDGGLSLLQLKNVLGYGRHWSLLQIILLSENRIQMELEFEIRLLIIPQKGGDQVSEFHSLVSLSRQVCSLGSREVILDLTAQNLIEILIIWLRDVVEVVLMVDMMHGKPSLIFKSSARRGLGVILVLVERVRHVLIFF